MILKRHFVQVSFFIGTVLSGEDCFRVKVCVYFSLFSTHFYILVLLYLTQRESECGVTAIESYISVAVLVTQM